MYGYLGYSTVKPDIPDSEHFPIDPGDWILIVNLPLPGRIFMIDDSYQPLPFLAHIIAFLFFLIDFYIHFEFYEYILLWFQTVKWEISLQKRILSFLFYLRRRRFFRKSKENIGFAKSFFHSKDIRGLQKSSLRKIHRQNMARGFPKDVTHPCTKSSRKSYLCFWVF